MEIEKFIEIVEDKSMLEYGLRVLMQAAETKKMPEEAYMPTFYDEMLEEAFMAVLEKIVNS